MLITGKAKRFFQCRILFVSLLVLQIIIAGTVAVSFYTSLRTSYYHDGQIQFERAFSLLNGKVENYVNGLHGMGGIYLLRGFQISNKETREYAQFRNFFSNFPGVLGFGFIRYVKAKGRATYEHEVQKKLGASSFKIKQIDLDPNRDLMVIEAIEPVETNFLALGLDVGSEKKRREAAIHAMRTGLPVMTEHIHLVQANRNEIGFLLYLPLFEGGVVPATLGEREKKIKGWAYAPVTSSSIKDYLVRHIDPSLAFEIYDQTNTDVPVKISGNTVLQSYQFEKVFNIGERKWILRANYEKEGVGSHIILLSIASFFTLGFALIALCIAIRNLVLSNDNTVKRAQTAEDWFSAIINSSNFCILSTDKNGTINTLNKTAESVIGYAESEVVRRLSPSVFLDPLKNSSFTDLLQSSRLKGLEVLEVDVVKKNGSLFPARLIVNPVFGNNLEVEGFLFILEDLTEVVKMRKEIELKHQQIVAASRLSALGELAAGLAHEINNPLAIINSKVSVTLDLSKKGNLNKTMLEESLTRINSIVLHIAQIVRGLKTLSRDSSSDPLLPVAVVDIVNDSLGLCNDRISKQGVSLFVECPVNLEVMGRASQFTQVLMNLLTNSLDAIEIMPEKWIRIQVEAGDVSVQIKVIDSGFGVSKEIAARILDPFFTTKETGRGTGLGLSISKSIVEKHKGNLYYESSASNTTFVIELPKREQEEKYLFCG